MFVRFRKFKITVYVLCILCISMSMSGCRFSPVLQEMIQDRFADSVDDRFNTEIDNNKDHQEETDDMTRKKTSDESQRKTEESQSKPVSGDEQNTQDADKGNAPSGGASQSSDPLNGNTSNDSPQISPNGSGSGGNGESGYDLVPSADGVRDVIDSRGVHVEVPKDVSSVAAPGKSAALLYLVGGGSVIKAASADFTRNSLIDSSVKQNVQELWDGDGSSVISDAAFNKLLSEKPEVCLEVQGNTAFSEQQIAKMKDAGISYVVLPELSTPENIKSAVKLAGTIVGNKSASGGVNAEAKADEYMKYVDSMISEITSKVKAKGSSQGMTDINTTSDGYYKGKYSLYLSGWDAEAKYRLFNNQYTTRKGSGSAYAGNSSTTECKAVSAFMGVAGIENTMELYETVTPNYTYVTPIVPTTRKLEIIGSKASSVDNNRLLQMIKTGLGKAEFPAVIVNDKQTADGIKASQLWSVYDHIVSNDGIFEANGFLAEDGSIIGSSVSAPYEIYVNPSGIGSWSGGSGESILESVWLAEKFYGAYSESEVRDKVKDFYSRFYQIQLSESQLSNILGGDTAL